jgi:hypothetical protein
MNTIVAPLLAALLSLAIRHVRGLHGVESRHDDRPSRIRDRPHPAGAGSRTPDRLWGVGSRFRNQ